MNKPYTNTSLKILGFILPFLVLMPMQLAAQDIILGQEMEYILEEGKRQMRMGNRSLSSQMIKQVLDSGKAENNPLIMAKALSVQADWFAYFVEYDSALATIKLAIEIAEANKLNPLLPQLFLQSGLMGLNKRQPLTTVDHCRKAKELAQKAGLWALLVQCDFCIEDAMGRYYYDHGEATDKPMRTLQNALPVVLETGDTSAYLSYLSRYIDMYRGEGSLDSVWLLLNQMEKILDDYPDLKRRAGLHTLRSIYFDLNGQPDSVYTELMKALAIAKQLDINELQCHYYCRLTELYNDLGKYEKAVAMIDSAVAVFPEAKTNLNDLYYRTYKKMGDPVTSLQYLEDWVAVKDSFYQSEKLESITEWETKYETNEKEKQIQAQRSRQNLLLVILGAILLGAVGLLWAFRSKQKANRELAEQKATIEQQANELKSLEQLKSRFFANVSHELRTPLSLMIGPLDSLLKKESDRPEKERRLLAFVKNNSQHLLKLVNEILDLSKLETGRLELKETTVHFHDFLQPLVAQFTSMGDSQSVPVNLDYQAEPDLYIQIDIGKFEKIVHNFLSNALKFTPVGGRIDVLVEEKEDDILLSVKDTGAGIHPDDLPHVFDRFYQSKQPNAPTQGGTGIGLSLCKELAELLGGKVWAESDPDSYREGKGSVFFFRFPKKEVHSPQSAVHSFESAALSQQSAGQTKMDSVATSRTSKTIQPSNHPTILIVEDNPELRSYIQSILEEDYHVLTAENGKVAWERLTEDDGRQMTNDAASPPSTFYRPPDLIISDLMMPVMDGFQLLEKVKAHDTLRHLPVIMLTARADVRVKLRALRIGVDDYLTKPFVEEELKVRIENLLRNQQERILAKANQVEEIADQTPSPPTEQDIWLEELEQKVTAELGNINLTAEYLAHEMALSRSQLFRRMKEYTGLTFNEYINEVRYQQARQMLEERSVVSVKAAAYSVGLKDVTYFSRQYKKRFGKTPSQYLLS